MMGNYFSRLASSSKDKGITVADLTKLLPVDKQYDEKPKKKKSKSNKHKHEGNHADEN